MSRRKVIVVGGGAAGFFAAITCAEANPDCTVTIYEATAHPLAKVKVSGGGRCNVTHACFEPRELVQRYPRGRRELIGAFHRWQPRDTVEWFAARGVTLKTEADGRMFPVTDRSQTIVDCLEGAAAKAGVRVVLRTGIKAVERAAPGAPDAGANLPAPGSTPAPFQVTLTTGETGRLAVEVGLEVEELRDVANSLLALFLRNALLLEGEAHVRRDVELRVEGVALKHHCDVPVSGTDRRDVLAADQDLARIERLESREHS
jgi:hypothetical protein